MKRIALFVLGVMTISTNALAQAPADALQTWRFFARAG